MAGLESFCSAARWTGLAGNGRDSWTSLGGGAGVAAGGCALACLDDTTSSQPARKIAPAANNAQIRACLFIAITSSSKFLKHVPGSEYRSPSHQKSYEVPPLRSMGLGLPIVDHIKTSGTREFSCAALWRKR